MKNSDYLTLTKELFYNRQHISRKQIEKIGESHIHLRLLEMAENLELIIRKEIYGNPLCDYNVSYPSNWVEALKDRWLPNFIRKYWPVKYERIEVKATELATKLAIPKNMGPVSYMRTNQYTFKDNGQES